jgi:hypothetical protein
MKTKLGSGRPGPRTTKAAARAKASPAPEPVQAWSGKLQIRPSPELIEFLNRLGARPDRGGSAFGLSNVMRQQLALFLAVIEESDPRKSRPPFPQEFYDLTIDVLAQPSMLNADLIRLLDGYIARQAPLSSLLEQRGLERSAYLEAIAGLDFPERVHLVEKALVRHAPTPPKLPSRRRRR